MKIHLLTAVIVIVTAVPVVAEKPEWAGKDKPGAEQKEAHKAGMEARESVEQRYGESEQKAKKEKQEKANQIKAMEKQQAKKSEQVMKETGKGSEQGQKSREQRKKWWKFWE